MSVSTTADAKGAGDSKRGEPKQRKGRATSVWLAMLLLVTAGVMLAWWGARGVRERTVQVQTIAAGGGATIKPVDGVLIDYEGRLADGTVFDTSAGRGPAPMIAGQVIPGFAQALTRMQKGGRYKIKIPSKLGYGAEPPAGGPIPPNADLEFDVHVVQVVPNAALMQGGGGPPQQ